MLGIMKVFGAGVARPDGYATVAPPAARTWSHPISVPMGLYSRLRRPDPILKHYNYLKAPTLISIFEPRWLTSIKSQYPALLVYDVQPSTMYWYLLLVRLVILDWLEI
ncbi:hypothetical protein CBL_02339 [Carabus blaptoides fortunei]